MKRTASAANRKQSSLMCISMSRLSSGVGRNRRMTMRSRTTMRVPTQRGFRCQVPSSARREKPILPRCGQHPTAAEQPRPKNEALQAVLFLLGTSIPTVFIETLLFGICNGQRPLYPLPILLFAYMNALGFTCTIEHCFNPYTARKKVLVAYGQTLGVHPSYAPARCQSTSPRSAERSSPLRLSENLLARKGRIANATRVSRKTGAG